jgi:hypothetical protein
MRNSSSGQNGSTGFLYTRSKVYHEMKRHEGLPVATANWVSPWCLIFLPVIVSDGLESWYLTEDYAFCERARRCGYRLVADTTIRLQHIGAYGYSLWPK